MSGIIQRVPWASQPQVAVEIDRGNPLTKGLLGVIIPANAGVLNKTAALVTEPTTKGIAFSGTAAVTTAYKRVPGIDSAATLLVFTTSAVVATVGALGGFGTDSGGNQLFALQNTDGVTTNVRGIIRLANGGGVSSVESSSLAGLLGSNAIEPWVVVYDGTSSLSLYRNGVNDTGTRQNTAVSGAATSLNQICANGIFRGTPNGSPQGQKQVLSAFWNRALTPFEVKAVSANPWQLFAPLKRRIWVPAAGSAVTTTTSLSAAIQAAQTATASVSAAIQASRSGTADIAAAIQIVRTLQATIDGAIQAPGSATASVNAYVQVGSSASTSLDAAIQRAVTATASLQAAVQASAAATASVNAYIQAGTIASASVNAAIQAALAATASVDAAIAVARNASVSLGASISVQGSVSAAMSAAIEARGSAAASLSAYVLDDSVIVNRYPSRTRHIYTERVTRSIKSGRISRSIKP